MPNSVSKVFDKISQTGMLPVIFAGAGVSKRYTTNKYDWKGLLVECISQYNDSPENKYREYKVDIEYKLETNKVNKFSINEGIGTLIERDFNKAYYKGRIKDLEVFNDKSPLKTFISQKLSDYKLDEDMLEEINLLRDLNEKMLTVVTTNYDDFFERYIFNKHEKVIGQDVFKKSEIGTLFKIHGCITQPESMVLTSRDYEIFKRKRKVLSAKLISLFTENPVIFIGYSLEDENIRSILLDIFQCIEEDWEHRQFEDRLIIIDYKEEQEIPSVGTYSMFIDDVEISLTKITTASYLPVLESMQKLKKKVRFRDLVHIKDIIYDVVQSHEGKKSKFINLLDEESNEEVDNDEVIVLIGRKNELLDSVGVTGLTAENLFDDALTGSLDSKLQGREKLLIEEHLPMLYRSNIVLPIHKYFSKVNYDEIELTDLVKKKFEHNLEDLLNNGLKNDLEIYNKRGFKTFDEIMDSNHGMTRKINFLVIKALNDSDADEIKDYLVNGGREILLKTNIGGTMFRKMVCAYDLKKYKNA